MHNLDTYADRIVRALRNPAQAMRELRTPEPTPQRCEAHPDREAIATIRNTALCGECAITQIVEGKR